MSLSRSRQLLAALEGFYDFRSSTYRRLPSAQPEVLVAPHAEIQVGHRPATRPTKPMSAVAAVHFAAFRFSSLTLFYCS